MEIFFITLGVLVLVLTIIGYGFQILHIIRAIRRYGFSTKEILQCVALVLCLILVIDISVEYLVLFFENFIL